MTEPFLVPSARMSALWAALIIILSVAGTGSTAQAQEELPVVRIMGVDAPTRVYPGESFTVSVVVDYSASYSTDIAILDQPTGFVLASKGLIIPAGRNLFNFQLTARDDPGAWALLVTVRIWWHDGWFASRGGNAFPFNVTVGTADAGILNIGSSLALTVVRVDGVPSSISSDGLELSIPQGFHTIEAESLIDIGDGTRAVFDHWSDGVRSSTRTVYLEDQLDLSALYLTEFFLTVESDLGETVGSGWYPAGANATFLVVNPFLHSDSFAGDEIAYGFSHWSGDVESTSPVCWTIMDRPKRTAAGWSPQPLQSTSANQLVLVSGVFVLCSAIMAAVAFALRRHAYANEHDRISRRRILKGLLLTVLAMSVQSASSPQANSLTILQPESITIGDALWYNWNQARSDTLLIWLGGGVVGRSALLVNPYEFESYNTMLFVQDLAKYYDVLALERGSTEATDPSLNRTMFREPYVSSDNFMERIRNWARGRDYRYIYVVGYSVGAMVAAEELVLDNPEEWASPNGLIIITTKIPKAASSKAGALRASLLMLYGDRIAPEFTVSGETFYERTPREGLIDGVWYHKEFHVIPDVEHEVWTVMDSGQYDSRALFLTVRFIETTKGLQFEQLKPAVQATVLNQTVKADDSAACDLEVVSVTAPVRVRTGEAFQIDSVIRYDTPSNITIAVVSYDPDADSILSASRAQFLGSGQTSFRSLILSGESPKTLRLFLIPLVYRDSGWAICEDETRNVLVEVGNGYTVTIIAGRPNFPVQFDGRDYQTEADGRLRIETTLGHHVISVSAILSLNDTSRLVFQQWNGTPSAPVLDVFVSSDITLFVIYRQQHYLSVESPFGETTGTGWYDENSTALFSVAAPVASGDTTRVFAGWSGDSHDSSASSILFIDGSKQVRASWAEVGETLPHTDVPPLPLQALFAMSFIVLLASVIFAIASARRAAHVRNRRFAGVVTTAPVQEDERTTSTIHGAFGSLK